MSPHKLHTIASLAESIAEEHIQSRKVNLEEIALENNITYSYGNYGDSFLGLLECYKKKFHIYINLDRLPKKEDPRTRFTFAHELGHYFIDDHRKCLKRGISLSFNNKISEYSDNIIEKEANHFATHLLLPQKQVLKIVKTCEYGFESIMETKNIMGASLICTAINYTKLDLVPCALISWSSKMEYKTITCSKSMLRYLGPDSLRIQKTIMKTAFETINNQSAWNYVHEELSLLSSWTTTVSAKSRLDCEVMMQTVKQGPFGWLTFLYLAN